MRVFYGSAIEVKEPEIRTGKFTKDFGEEICLATEASLKGLKVVESEKLSKK